jgi:hypothetical protein
MHIVQHTKTQERLTPGQRNFLTFATRNGPTKVGTNEHTLSLHHANKINSSHSLPA